MPAAFSMELGAVGSSTGGQAIPPKKKQRLAAITQQQCLMLSANESEKTLLPSIALKHYAHKMVSLLIWISWSGTLLWDLGSLH